MNYKIGADFLQIWQGDPCGDSFRKTLGTLFGRARFTRPTLRKWFDCRGTPLENRAFSSAMSMTIRSEKFWKGPEHILDASEVVGIGGKPWMALLLPDRLVISEPTGKLEIMLVPGVRRDSWGKLEPGQSGNTIAIYLASRECTVDLNLRRLVECLPDNVQPDIPISRFQMMMDFAPGQRHQEGDRGRD
jgi:hypothetical protein